VIEDEQFFREYPGVVAFLRAALDDEMVELPPSGRKIGAGDPTRLTILVMKSAGALHARYLPAAWQGSPLSILFKIRHPLSPQQAAMLLDGAAEAWAFLKAQSDRRTNATTQ
jgi:hypothetical protein